MSTADGGPGSRLAGAAVRGVAADAGHAAHVHAGARQAAPRAQPVRARVGATSPCTSPRAASPPRRSRWACAPSTPSSTSSSTCWCCAAATAGWSVARSAAASPSSTRTSWPRCSGWTSTWPSPRCRRRWPTPSRSPTTTTHATYDPAHAARFFRALSTVTVVMNEHHAHFRGRSTPVHFFWGTFDLALTRYSGQAVEPPKDSGIITRVGGDAEAICAGWWPGDERSRFAAFYAYAYPAPDGIGDVPVEPGAARWDTRRRRVPARVRRGPVAARPARRGPSVSRAARMLERPLSSAGTAVSHGSAPADAGSPPSPEEPRWPTSARTSTRSRTCSPPGRAARTAWRRAGTTGCTCACARSAGTSGAATRRPGKHTTAHFHSTGHPIVRSFEPGEDWYFCYPDDLVFELEDAPPAPSHP